MRYLRRHGSLARGVREHTVLAAIKDGVLFRLRSAFPNVKVLACALFPILLEKGEPKPVTKQRTVREDMGIDKGEYVHEAERRVPFRNQPDLCFALLNVFERAVGNLERIRLSIPWPNAGHTGIHGMKEHTRALLEMTRTGDGKLALARAFPHVLQHEKGQPGEMVAM